MVYIERENSPRSTRQIAQKLGYSWHTVQEYCMELLFRKKIERLEIAGRHIWISLPKTVSTISPKNVSSSENLFSALLEKELGLEQHFQKEFDKEISKELTATVEEVFRSTLNRELKTLIKNISSELQSSFPKKTRENRTTVQSAAGGDKK